MNHPLLFCVINLDRSPERLASIRTNLEGLGVPFTRIAAVDAKQLTDAEVNAVYDPARNARRYFAPLKRGEVACFLSHRKAWAHFLASGADFLVLLEDDTRFLTSPQGVLDLATQAIGQDRPTMVKLYAKRAARGFRVVTFNDTHALTNPALVPLGCQAQLLNRPAAAKLLESTATFWEPVDVVLQRWWDTGVRVLVLQPNLVSEESAQLGGSTIQGRSGVPWTAKLAREIRRPWFRLKRRLGSWYHGLGKRD